MPTQLDELKKHTIIVSDTGDVEQVKRLKPQDGTTNPSLIYKAAQMPEYANLVDDAIAYGKGDLGLVMVSSNGDGDHVEQYATADGKMRTVSAKKVMKMTQNSTVSFSDDNTHMTPHFCCCYYYYYYWFLTSQDKVAVNFGAEITKIVPGYVSTEVDARLSFDTEATIAKARKIIDLYKEVGVDKSRILIKVAATWEGIKAAEVLEKEGITCNLTLIFSLAQAIACGDAGCTLISPFVGRIFDYYKKAKGVDAFKPEEDPGVVSVTQIYNYYKKYGYNTIVMGASFRNKDQITELCGCDRLTISPKLLDELADCQDPVPKKLEASQAATSDVAKIDMDEKTFRWMINEDPMATEKLSGGIRQFAADIVSLEKMIQEKMDKK